MYYKFLVDKISKGEVDFDSLFNNITDKTTTVTFCNPLTFKVLGENPQFEGHLEKVDYIFSDGILLCKFIRKVTGTYCHRYSFDGNSVAEKVFAICRKRNYNVALVGTTNENIEEAVEKLKGTINIVYHRNGFLNADEKDKLPAILAEKKVNVVIFGMGTPYQEYMLTLMKERDFKGVAFTCGGYLEQVAKKDILYYPDWINKYNLRWLYRVAKEPGKLLHRYVFDYWPFYKEFARA